MHDVNIKTVLLGNSKIGKTSLVRRFLENKFISSDNAFMSTIGGVFTSKEMFSFPHKKVILCIWDTAGEEKYESVTRSFYRGANAAIVCYDVTCAKSWNRAKNWVSELKQFEEKCIIYLCATKMDLIKDCLDVKATPNDVVKKYISDMSIKRHFETSSKTGENVGKMFTFIVRDYMELNKDIFSDDEIVRLGRRNVPNPCCSALLRP